MTGVDPLLDLLATCVVPVEIDGRFLADLALSLSNEADRLTEVGRADEATHGFERVLAEYAEPGWPRGEHEALPPWLGHPDIDAAAEEILIAWMTTDDWQATFTHLAEHAATILSDRGEASLEHLIDNNPFNGTLDQHLVILQTARIHGVDAVRDQFLAGLVVEQPDRLTYLALLQLSRDLGVDEAHALVTDPPALADAVAAATTPEERWQLVRLAAGLDPGDAENHLAHALTAAELGGLDEASWAMERCRDTLATWQRPGIARRLEEFAAAHPDLDVTPLREALQAG